MSPLYWSSYKILSKNYTIQHQVLHLLRKFYVIPVFVKVKGEFLNEENHIKSSQNIFKDHLTKHIQDLYNFSTIYKDWRKSLLSETGHVFGRAIIFSITKSLAKHYYLSSKTKNSQISLDWKSKLPSNIILFQ